MAKTMSIRTYISSERASEAHGRDEGGYYKYVEVPAISPKLKKRMAKCSGCHDSFYNNRENCTGNHCWSLDSDTNFKGRGKPKCYH